MFFQLDLLGGIGMMKVCTLHPFPGCPEGVWVLSQPRVVCVGTGLAAPRPSGRCIHGVL